MRLIPKNSEYTWAMYSVLYFGFFWIDPIVSRASLQVWIITLLATLVFLVLYFGLFWVSCRQGLLHLAAMILMGFGFAKFNGGATTFFIFAAACGPFVVDTEPDGFKVLAAVEAAAVLTWWILHLNGWFLLFAAGLSFVIGISNIHFAQRNRTNAKLIRAQGEIEQLAKVAERERIARDLHDVLGHTLSVIILKSELAGKLMERDPVRARAEIADVEQTSRAALAEVRSTIRGYRAHSLEAELKNARATLETAGVAVQAESAEVPLTPAQESVVALVVREAVTNVVRHAEAHNCHLRLAPLNGTCLLEIQDDGRGGAQEEGNGLRGMRERIEALGGTLKRETKAGTKLIVQFPLQTAKANGVL